MPSSRKQGRTRKFEGVGEFGDDVLVERVADVFAPQRFVEWVDEGAKQANMKRHNFAILCLTEKLTEMGVVPPHAAAQIRDVLKEGQRGN